MVYNASEGKQNQLNNTEMAKISGTSVSTLNKPENGEMPPRRNMSVFYQIHRHFGIAPPAYYPSRKKNYKLSKNYQKAKIVAFCHCGDLFLFNSEITPKEAFGHFQY